MVLATLKVRPHATVCVVVVVVVVVRHDVVVCGRHQ